jgi:hypothetical protein
MSAACPKCGSTAGYTYRMTVVYIMAGRWGEQSYGDPSGDGSTGMASCLTCGHKCRVETAEKMKPQNNRTTAG